MKCQYDEMMLGGLAAAIMGTDGFWDANHPYPGGSFIEYLGQRVVWANLRSQSLVIGILAGSKDGAAEGTKGSKTIKVLAAHQNCTAYQIAGLACDMYSLYWSIPVVLNTIPPSQFNPFVH